MERIKLGDYAVTLTDDGRLEVQHPLIDDKSCVSIKPGDSIWIPDGTRVCNERGCDFIGELFDLAARFRNIAEALNGKV